MAESTEHKQGDLNMFKEGTDSKTVEKETINLEKPSYDANSTAASIAYEIDEEIAKLQSEDIMAVANSIGRSMNLESGETRESNLEQEAALRESNRKIKAALSECNLEIEAALRESNLENEAASNSTLERGSEEATSSVPDRTSLTECKLAAYFAEKRAEDARLVIAMGQDLLEKMSATIDVLKSHIDVFAEKTIEARGFGTERGDSVADYYISIASRYEAAITALERRYLNVEIALERVKECVTECMKYAALAAAITNETLNESRSAKFAACFWNNKGKAAIKVTLKKQRAALFLMGRIWLSVRHDMIYEESNRTVVESDEETQQCQNRERKTKIGHIVATLLGLALISITTLFKVWSDSFNAILALGLLTTGWCAVYWSIKLYKYLKENDNEETTIETERREEDRYINNCERRLAIVEAHLRKYKVFIDPDKESDTASETTTVDDAIQ